MNSSSILITGGAGFIGSRLALHLRGAWPDAKVVCMDNLYRRGSELNVTSLRSQSLLFHHGDIRSPGDFPEGPFDFLIECSAEPSVLAGHTGSPDYLIHTNLLGAYYCLEKARAWQAGVIFLSTSRVYPVAPLEAHPFAETPSRFVWEDTGPVSGISARGVSEDMPLAGARSLYGFTKLAAEKLIEEYRAAFGLRGVVNRCGVVAGPGQFGKVDQGVVALWVMAHAFRRPLSYIGYGGAGKQVRDVLHVADLCELISLQIENFVAWDGWLGNVAGGLENSVSLLKLTALCREICGVELDIRSVAETRPADLRVFIADCARLQARTSWRPARNVAKVVEDTFRWVCDHRMALAAVV